MATNSQQRMSREARDRLRSYEARREVAEGRQRRRVRDNIAAVIGVAVVAILAVAAQIAYFSVGPGAPEAAPSESPTDDLPAGENIGVPEEEYAGYVTWTGDLVLNDVTLGIELDGANAPQAVSAFLFDVENGYYPGKTCHRLATSPGFELLQCGSLDGTGAGDPDFRYGPIENAPADDQYPAGTIAMARAGGDAYSNGHQFFIVYGDTTIPSDPVGGYTVIGRVTSGLEELVAAAIADGIDPDQLSADGTGAPAVPVTITDVVIHGQDPVVE